METLLDMETGEILRMRGKMPGEAEAREIPVEEGSYTYVQPRNLTRESLEGAMVGRETVRVPAGSYVAEHVRYGGAGAGAYEWWLSGEVPGGIVRYSRSYEEMETEGPDAYNWTAELVASGRRATSELAVSYRGSHRGPGRGGRSGHHTASQAQAPPAHP